MRRIDPFPAIIALICFLLFQHRLIRLSGLVILSFYVISFFVSRIMSLCASAQQGQKTYYCYHGSREELALTIKNRSFFPMDKIIVINRGVGRQVLSLSGRSEDTLNFPINTRERGVHRAGPVIILGGDPVYFFPWIKRINSFASIVVYPRFFPPHLILEQGVQGGNQKSSNPLFEDVTQLKAIRKFRQGDPLKKINWKATAKTGTFQSMDFSNTLTAPACIVLDINLNNYPLLKKRHTMVERSIEAAASLAVAYIKKHEKCGIFTRGKSETRFIPLAGGNGHILTILEELSRLKPEDGDTDSILDHFLSYNIVLPQGTHLYIITPRIDADLVDKAAYLQKRHYYIKLVNAGLTGASTPLPDRMKVYMLTSYGREYLDEKQ